MNTKKKCAIPLCQSTLNINYHKFPKTPLKLRNDWMKACQLSPKDSRTDLRVCYSHFCDSDYKPLLNGLKRKQLKSYVVPHLNIPREITRFLPPDLVLPDSLPSKSLPFIELLPIKPVPPKNLPSKLLPPELFPPELLPPELLLPSENFPDDVTSLGPCLESSWSKKEDDFVMLEENVMKKAASINSDHSNATSVTSPKNRKNLGTDSAELLSHENQLHPQCTPFVDFHSYSNSKESIKPLILDTDDDSVENDQISPTVHSNHDKILIAKLRAQLRMRTKSWENEKNQNKNLTSKLKKETNKRKAIQKSHRLIKKNIENAKSECLDKTKLMSFLEERGYTTTQASAFIHKKSRVKYGKRDIIKAIVYRSISSRLYEHLRRNEKKYPMPCRKTLQNWENKLCQGEPG